MRDFSNQQFDLPTERFIVQRWASPLGQKVLESIVVGIKESADIRAILDEHVLDHPDAIDPYGYPTYPRDSMKPDSFWVLTSDDLRGARFYSEDFSNSKSLGNKSLSYAAFQNCNLAQADLSLTEVSFTRFIGCDMAGVELGGSGGIDTSFNNCDLKRSCLRMVGLVNPEFGGADLRGAYFEDAFLENISVDYRTRFDENLQSTWRTRSMPPDQRPDLLRAIRSAYIRQEIWDTADRFFYRERLERRRYVLAAHINWKRPKTLARLITDWLSAVTSGYGTSIPRVIGLCFYLIFGYAISYYLLGVPVENNNRWSNLGEAVYFSMTNFATLGYGDLVYAKDHPLLRLAGASEALLGAIVLAVLVTVLARKAFR